MASRGLAETAAEAMSLIEQGSVLVNGAVATKASTLVSKSEEITLKESGTPFASRGGEKLAGALEDLGIDPTGCDCLDAGAGSGGFTDCLLRSGAIRVTAIDVGYGQFDFRLRNDPRVRLIERTNLRLIPLAELDPPFDLIVGDLSFISLTAVMEKLASALTSEGRVLLLVKPQFEAGPDQIPAGGVVRDPEVWRETLDKVVSSIEALSMGVSGIVASRLKGAKGNTEFFIRASPTENGPAAELIQKAMEGALP